VECYHQFPSVGPFHLPSESFQNSLFRHRTIIHGFWPREQGPVQDTYNIGENPQYIVELPDHSIDRNPSLWILLSRHVTKEEQLEGKVCFYDLLICQSEFGHHNLCSHCLTLLQVDDFLTVHLHRNDATKQRIWYPGSSGRCILTGAYTNSPQVLVRYDVTTKEDKLLSVVLSQYRKTRDIPYTLSIFCTEEFTFCRPPNDLEFCVELKSSWTESSSGGTVGRFTYGNNPMFAVHVPKDRVKVELRLSTSKDVAINTMLFPVKRYGEGVDCASGKALLDSGRYRHGFVAIPRTHLPAGAYVLIVSRFNQAQPGVFQLKFYSSSRLKCEEIPR